MGRGSVFSGSAFKAATWSAIVFLLVLVATGVGGYKYVQQTMILELEAQIAEEQILFQDIYDERGAAGLINVIESLQTPLSINRRGYAVFASDGTHLGGNSGLAPDFVGWKRKTIQLGFAGNDQGEGEAPPPEEFYLGSFSFGETSVVVGRKLDLIGVAEKTLFRAFLAASAILVLSILLAGYLLSRQSLRKLQAIEDTMNTFTDGNLSARITVSNSNDQIDRIAGGINAHLTQLSSLITSTKASAAAIAHDLRRPLSRAFLNLEEAQNDLDKGIDPRNSVETAQHELTQLNHIFDTILRISQIGASPSPQGFKPLNLAQLLDDLAGTYRVVAEESGQTLNVTCPAPDVTLTGDVQMIQQMIVNLLQNAVTHCPAGATIDVALIQNKEEVVLTVTDSGPGLSDADRARAFDPFFRADESRTTEGSGLGLSLVKAIADRHGATVSLTDNRPGLCVTVHFPR